VLEEVRTPEPRQGEVRVRAEALGVGRPDILVRNGTYKWMPALPTIPGAEMVGIVDRLGEGADPRLLGKRVLVSARELIIRGGCYAQCICVPDKSLYTVPVSIDPVDAVSLPNFQVALALFELSGCASPKTILVPGAAGAVATALAQVARSRGVKSIGTASTQEKAAFARAQGFDDVLLPEASALYERVLSRTGGRGVDLAFDHLGGQSLVDCIRALAPFGTALSFNVVTGAPTEDVFALMRSLLGRSLAVRTFSMHTLDSDVDTRRALMGRAIEEMARGVLRAPPALRFPLSDASGAHELQESGSSLGKIVLLP